MNSFRIIFLFFSICLSSLYAGEYADAFLLASQHPQAQSLGFSTVASSIHSGHALNNPAGFARVKSSRIGLVYDQFADLSNNLSLEATYASGGKYNLGLTVIHSSIDDLFARPNLSGLPLEIRRDSVLSTNAGSQELIAYREDGVFLTIARQYEFEIHLGWKFFKIPCRVPLGFSVKYIDKLLVDNRGLGSGIDFGGQLIFSLVGMNRTLSNTEFALGLFFSDILNTPVYWTTEHQDAIKRAYVFGYAVTQHLEKLSSDVTISTSRQNRFGDEKQYGLEVRIKDMIFLRGGHDGFTPSFGLGIGLKKFIIDYSFSQQELANRQKIGINYLF